MAKNMRGDGKHVGEYHNKIDNAISQAESEGAHNPRKTAKHRQAGQPKSNPQPGVGRYRVYSRSGEFQFGYGGL